MDGEESDIVYMIVLSKAISLPDYWTWYYYMCLSSPTFSQMTWLVI